MAHLDIEARRLADRERGRRQHAERLAAGICVKCGRAPVVPERTHCEPCADKRRVRDRARHARAKAEGRPCGGRDIEARRRVDRERSRRRREARLAAGHCIRCGTPLARGRPVDVRALPRGPAAGEAGAAGRTPRRRPLREMRGARTRRGDLLQLLRGRPDRAAPAQPGSGPRGRPPALCRAARPGRLHKLRKARQRGGRVPGLPRRRARPLRRPPVCPGLCRLPHAHRRQGGLLRDLRRRQGRAPRPRGRERRPATAVWRTARRGPLCRVQRPFAGCGALCALRRRQYCAARPRGGERQPAPALCRTEGAGPLCRLQCAIARYGAVRALLAQAAPASGGVSRHSDMGPELDGDRDCHRPGPGHL